MHLMELSREQATAYCDFVRSRHEDRLRELAWWMSTTSGPVDSMDGSLPSLDELAAWVDRFRDRDLPGLPNDPELLVRGPWEGLVISPDRDGNWEVVSADADRRARREGYLDESLTHYLLEVVRRADPSARWEVSPEKKARVPTVDLHATGIASAFGWRPVDYRWSWYWRDRDEKGAVCSDFFAMWLKLTEVPALAVRAESVLSPLLGVTPSPPLRPPRFPLPSALSGRGDVARFYDCRGAHRDVVRSALTIAGFRSAGNDILDEDFVDGARFLHVEGRFEAAVITDGTELLAIAMLTWDSYPWMHLSAEVALLRAASGLRPIAPTPQLLQAIGAPEQASESSSPGTASEAGDMAFAYPPPRRHRDRVEKWKPLPVKALVAALRDLGVRAANGSISTGDLVDGAELARDDLVITATVTAARGKPRAVWFEVHNITQEEWDAFHARMTELATATRARFCPDGDLLDGDDD